MPKPPFFFRKSGIPALNLASLILAGGIFTLSGCENDFSFTDPVNREICTDALDNDGDEKTDCRDTECGDVCRPQLTLNPLPATVTTDSLTIGGTHQQATSISVIVSPSGLGGQAQITGSAWSFTVRSLTVGTVGMVLVAVDSTGLWRDTVSAGIAVQEP